MIHGSIEAAHQRVMTPGRRWRANLEEAVALWPTPKGSAANYGRPLADDHGDLQAAVLSETLPTPTANRWSGLQSHGQNALLGQLNPQWVEWLMGYPAGWTDCEGSGTPSSPK